MLSGQFTYTSTTTEVTVNNQTTTSEREGFYSDIRLDYEIDYSGFLIGLVYSHLAGGNPTDVLSGYGVSLSYQARGVIARAGYLFSAKQVDKSANPSTETTYSGDGILLSLGYEVDFGGGLSFGPHISYRSYDLDEEGAATPNLTENLKYSEVIPLIGLSYRFGASSSGSSGDYEAY